MPRHLGRAVRGVVVFSTFVTWLASSHARPAARHETSPMLEPHTASLLVDYFEGFLRDKDIEAFHRNVSSRYTEGTLVRLSQSGGIPARRAAVLALGLMGTYATNEAVARRLKDSDPTVRDLAQNALWAIWFRADSSENNATLQQVRDMISRERLREAEELASSLIARSPGFAEAHNQRAVARFLMGNYTGSAQDCRKVLELNPYHIGAASGLGQCYLKLDRRADALDAFRKAFKIQPYSKNLKETVEMLEAGE